MELGPFVLGPNFEMENGLYCGEHLDLIALLPDACIDLTVTSPPYDELRDYEGYDFDFEALARALWRVTKSGGIVVWVVGDRTVKGTETGTSFRQALYFKDVGFNLHDTMIYKKINVPASPKVRYFQVFEYMFVFSKGRPQAINLLYDRPNVTVGVVRKVDGMRTKDGKKSTKRVEHVREPFGRRFNVWEYATGTSPRDHPAVFPEALAYDHIVSWSDEDHIVFDPMSGSGTTAKAAVRAGRKYLGFDVAQQYVDDARVWVRQW